VALATTTTLSGPNTQRNLTPQQRLLKQNFRNQADLLAKSMSNSVENQKNVSSSLNASFNSFAFNNTNITPDNSKQMLIEAVYEECPFHKLRTEWYIKLRYKFALEIKQI
jgi:hypothetical protein